MLTILTRHGACFNTQTGDIENAPALDPINTFPVTVKDDGIYITAVENAVKDGSRVANVSCKVPSGPHVIIVGGFVLKPKIPRAR